MISTDINNPDCDPVELLREFMFWVNNVKRPVSVLEKIEAFITPNVCEWLLSMLSSIRILVDIRSSKI